MTTFSFTENQIDLLYSALHKFEEQGFTDESEDEIVTALLVSLAQA